MKRSLYIVFNFVVVIILTLVLMNENSCTQERPSYVEVLEYEIEEEEKVDAKNTDSFNQLDLLGDDGAKKHTLFWVSKQEKKDFYLSKSLTLSKSLQKRINYDIPKYILFCSLIVYA